MSVLLRRLRGTTAVALALAVIALAGGPVASVASVPVTGSPVLGGPLHAEIYPSGVDTAPDGTVVVADTGNNQVVRYAADGTQLWRVGTFGAGTGMFDNPRDVAVAADGSIYVADTRNSRVVHLAADGTWLDQTSGSGAGFSFPLGVSWRAGLVYVADTGRDRVVVLDEQLVQQSTIVANGACTSIADNRDAQADAAGNVYVAGYKTNQVLVFGPGGECLRTWGSTGTAPGKFRTPYGVDLAQDPVTGKELVYVADGLNNRVQVFTRQGDLVGTFGSYGEPTVPGTLTTTRRVAVARDGTGDVWVADLWGDRVERWARTADGWVHAATIGAVMPPPTPTAVFHEPRGTAYAPGGDVWVTDTVHHQVVRMAADGSIVATCGQRAAEGTQLGQFNWPRGLAVDPATGNLWIADTKQHQLQVLTDGCAPVGFVRNSTASAGSDARSFNWPYDVAIRPTDRTAFVVDTQNHRVKAYDVATASWATDSRGPAPAALFGSRGSGTRGFAWPSAVAVGPDGDVYVADRGNNRVQELSYAPGTGFAFVRSWTAGGSLDKPEGVAVLPDGRVAVADSDDDEVVLLAADGTVAETWTGLAHPSALEVTPAGEILVSDTYADVLRVLTPPPVVPPDTTGPVVTTTWPTAAARVAPGQLVVQATATDDRGVTGAWVAVRRSDTSQWLQADGTWGRFAWLAADLASTGSTSTTFSRAVDLPLTGSYAVQVRAADAAGNQDAVPRPSRSFTVAPPPDTTPPTGTVTAPAGTTVTLPVTLAGTAADDTGVARVQLGIRQSATGAWWNGTGWQATATKVTAVLSDPGAPSTTWSYVLDGVPTGGYGFSTDVVDVGGLLATGTGRPGWRSFTVVAP